MELNHLKYFYAVAKEGSFTRAALKLRIQQPTISKMVSQLESQLGLTLVERHPKGVRLTKSGFEIFRNCKDIFDRVEDIRVFSDREKVECHGPLAFGATDSVSSYLVPEILSGFLNDHPKVRPAIFTGTSNLICNEILDGKIEFGFFFAAPDPRGFDIEELFEVPFQMVIATNATKRNRRWDPRAAIIISREIDYAKGRPSPSQEMLTRQHLKVQAMITSNTYDSQKRLVKEGLGAALIPGFMAKNGIRDGIFTLLHPKKSFHYSLKLITRKGKVLSKNAEVFLEVFRRVAPGLVGR